METHFNIFYLSESFFTLLIDYCSIDTQVTFGSLRGSRQKGRKEGKKKVKQPYFTSITRDNNN